MSILIDLSPNIRTRILIFDLKKVLIVEISARLLYRTRDEMKNIYDLIL